MTARNGTGLGHSGVGEYIYKGRQEPEDIARGRRWWGEQMTNSAEGNSVSAELNGTIDLMVLETCPQAQYNGLTLEYGSLSGIQVLNTLRADHWLYCNPQSPDAHNPTDQKPTARCVLCGYRCLEACSTTTRPQGAGPDCFQPHQALVLNQEQYRENGR
nr:DUF2817 domain-containing protein [Pseudomonas sp. TH49]